MKVIKVTIQAKLEVQEIVDVTQAEEEWLEDYEDER